MVLFFLSLLFLIQSIHSQNTHDLEFWNKIGRDRIEKLIKNTDTARESAPKNIILFIGDGMGLPVLTGARVHTGMREGRENINTNHFFEDFPYSGLVKTSSLDFHTTDSAAGAAAFLTARKVKQNHLLTKPSASADCSGGEKDEINDSIPELALKKGLSVGIVTTTRITHATPAASFAKGVSRTMEYDKGVLGTKCTDIARQMLQYPANQFTVVMGGGADNLQPISEGGRRMDGVNVIEEWKKIEGNRKVVRNKEEMKKEEENADYMMGIFSKDSFNFMLDDIENNTDPTPRLFEMTQSAIRMLQKKKKGYFLMVEGGLIDWAEHRNQMHLAFEELEEFDKAIEAARHLTSSSDTLIIVTADHGHAVTLPGYVPKDRPIFELAPPLEEDKIDKTVKTDDMAGIFFATGPGYKTGLQFTREQAKNSQFRSPSFYPLRYGAHGGEDVGLWADGPYARLLSGTIENTQVGYTIKYLLCLDENDICVKREPLLSTKTDTTVLILLIWCSVFSFLSFLFLGILIVLRIRASYNVRQEQEILSN